LPGVRHNYPPERMLKVTAGSSLTFDIFFNRVCSSIEGDEQINELRQKREEVLRMVEHLQQYLEQKLKFIRKRDGTKTTRV